MSSAIESAVNVNANSQDQERRAQILVTRDSISDYLGTRVTASQVNGEGNPLLVSSPEPKGWVEAHSTVGEVVAHETSDSHFIVRPDLAPDGHQRTPSRLFRFSEAIIRPV
jgi:hypothetical protein